MEQQQQRQEDQQIFGLLQIQDTIGTSVSNHNSFNNTMDHKNLNEFHHFMNGEGSKSRQVDSVLRSLVSEVEDQRRQFDKKWQMMMNYLMRKNEEQEHLIRKLKSRLQQYENVALTQEDDKSISEMQQYNSKRLSDPNSFRSHLKQPTTIITTLGGNNVNLLKSINETINEDNSRLNEAQENEAQNFDQLQQLFQSRTDRNQRFYSLGNNHKKLSTFRKGQDPKDNQPSTGHLMISKHSIHPVIKTPNAKLSERSNQQQQQQLSNQQNNENLSQNEQMQIAFINQLKQQLVNCQKIIMKDKEDKVKLIHKLREMKQQIEQLSKNQIASPRVQKELPSYQNAKVQTETIEQNTENLYESIQQQQIHQMHQILPDKMKQEDQISVGINTSITEQDEININNESIALQMLQTHHPKVMYDEFEEQRLKDNIAFWKEKCDILLLEKKEFLHDQMTQHKLIRNYEQQIEEFKQLLKQRDQLIEVYQIEKKLVSGRVSVSHPMYQKPLNEQNNNVQFIENMDDDKQNLHFQRSYLDGNINNMKESMLSDIRLENQDKQTIRIINQNPGLPHESWIQTASYSDVSNEYHVMSSNNNSNEQKDFHRYPIETQIHQFLNNITSADKINHQKPTTTHQFHSIGGTSQKRKQTPKKTEPRLRYQNSNNTVTKHLLQGSNDKYQQQQQPFIDQSALSKSKNFDIINRSSLNQIHSKFNKQQHQHHAIVSNTVQPISVKQHSFQPVRENAYNQSQSGNNHLRQTSNNQPASNLRSREQSHNEAVKLIAVSQHGSDTQLTLNNQAPHGSSRNAIANTNSNSSVLSKASTSIYKSTQALALSGSQPSKKQQRKVTQSGSKSRTQSNSNKKVAKVNSFSSKGGNNGRNLTAANLGLITNNNKNDKVQLIEANQNMNLIETIIKTISSQHNQTIVEVLERINPNDVNEEMYSAETSERYDHDQSISTDQYSSPMTHAKNILNAYKLQQPTAISTSKILNATSQLSMVPSKASFLRNKNNLQNINENHETMQSFIQPPTQIHSRQGASSSISREKGNNSAILQGKSNSSLQTGAKHNYRSTVQTSFAESSVDSKTIKLKNTSTAKQLRQNFQKIMGSATPNEESKILKSQLDQDSRLFQMHLDNQNQYVLQSQPNHQQNLQQQQFSMTSNSQILSLNNSNTNSHMIMSNTQPNILLSTNKSSMLSPGPQTQISNTNLTFTNIYGSQN
ncbi:UNKNOWN [Stylonychia lemnae]|uniref:Uncharacterized protein n=1 Tax=Stylonychia lemnae TaxID=5949 RepID=A0A078AVL3_STYLE|nr:UNKNOWN [Stylonychia lemnae]|eukprot:CDW86410.1 UNKNOWN [Stylonychia lemnae]